MPRPWMPEFLRVLSLIPNVTAAARQAGITRQTAHEWKGRDDGFSVAWDEALLRARDNVERILHTFATTGLPVKRRKTRTRYETITTPSGVQVEQVAERVEEEWEDTERSVTALIFYLKAHYPERYRWSERHEHTGRDGGAIEIENLTRIDAQIAALNAEIAARAGGEPVPEES